MPVTESRKFLTKGLYILCATNFSGSLAVGDEVSDWSELPNFHEIRMQHGGRDDFVESCGVDGWVDSEDPLFTYFDDKDWDAVAASAAARLETCPVSLQLHAAMAVAMAERGRRPEAEIYLAWYKGLIDSIIASGDGESADSAFVTISRAEEYEFLGVFQLTPKSLSVTLDGRDRFVVTDEEGREDIIYFFPKYRKARLANVSQN